MNVSESDLSSILRDEPVERVERDGVEYVLLGTAHVSRRSMEAVKALLAQEPFDAVAVELCDSRVQSILHPEAFKQMDLFQVIRRGKTGMVAASLLLSSFQKRLADQHGIQPGAEMKVAMDGAQARELPLWAIDREVGTTLKRAWHNLGIWQRLTLLSGLLAGAIERAEIDGSEVEKLKQGDLLESALGEFASDSTSLYHTLIAERDAYMAAHLRTLGGKLDTTTPRRVLVVIGAGHLKGLRTALCTQQGDPQYKVAELAKLPPKARWPKWLAVGLVLLVFAAIGWAFHRNTMLGTQVLRDWLVYTGGFAALGALIAGAHPISILAAFIAAPIKPFRPGIPAGGISALAVAWVRRPRVSDFESLRADVAHWKGWWKNRVARTLLNFFVVSLCTIIGEYLAGFHIVHKLL